MKNLDTCDIHLGKKGSLKKGRLLRQEWKDILGKTYSDLEWLQLDRQFYSEMQFHTDVAREKYDAGRIKNLEKIAGAQNEVIRRFQKPDNLAPISRRQNIKRKEQEQSQNEPVAMNGISFPPLSLN